MITTQIIQINKNTIVSKLISNMIKIQIKIHSSVEIISILNNKIIIIVYLNSHYRTVQLNKNCHLDKIKLFIMFNFQVLIQKQGI